MGYNMNTDNTFTENVKQQLKIGEALKTTQDVEYQTALTGRKRTIKKDTPLWVGADNLVHYLDGTLQPIDNTCFEVKGYDTKGIAEWLWLYICKHTVINEEILCDYHYTPELFKQLLECALDELGFED